MAGGDGLRLGFDLLELRLLLGQLLRGWRWLRDRGQLRRL